MERELFGEIDRPSANDEQSSTFGPCKDGGAVQPIEPKDSELMTSRLCLTSPDSQISSPPMRGHPSTCW